VPEEPVAIVRAMFEAFTRRDLDAVLPFLADDVELRVPGTSSRAGRDGAYRGHAGIRDYFADVAAVWDELTVEPEDFRATEGSVVIFGHVHGRRGGQAMETNVLWTWKLRDGKITSGSVFDTP
jgi:ketosteroid isomerase-like protein